MMRKFGLALFLLVSVAGIPGWADDEPVTPWGTLRTEAMALRDSENYDAAKAKLEEALALVEQGAPQSAEHEGILLDLGTLEELYLEDLDTALGRYQAIITMVTTNADPEDDLHEVGYLQMVADIYFKQDRVDDALAAYERSIELEEQGFGSEHHLVGNDQRRLAAYYLEYGRDDKLEALSKRMLEIRTKFEGEKKIAAVGPNLDLARLYVKQGKLEDARTHYDAAIELIETAKREYPNSVYTTMVRDLLPKLRKELKSLPAGAG